MSTSSLSPGAGRPIDEIVDAYLEEHAGPAIDDGWARFHVSNLVFGDAATREEAWPIILAAIDRAENDEQRRFLGAGDLETLITMYGPQFIDRIEQAAGGDDSHLRTALQGVWASGTEEWPRIEVLLEDRSPGEH